MKKILSAVLSVVMVLATFAMLVPTASAAEAAKTPKVLFEEDFDDTAYASLTDAALATAIFGEGNYSLSENNDAGLSLVDSVRGTDKALKVDGGTAWNTGFLLSTDGVVSDGYVAEVEYMIRATNDKNNLTPGSRWFGFSDAIDNRASGDYVAGQYTAYAYPDKTRMAFRGGDYGSWTPSSGTAPLDNNFASTNDTWFKMKVEVSFEGGIVMYNATWNSETNAWNDYVVTGRITPDHNEDIYAANVKAKAGLVLTDTVWLALQEKNAVTIDNLKVTSLTSIPAPAVAKMQYKDDMVRFVGVIDEEVFNSASKVGFKVTVGSVTKDVDCQYVYETIGDGEAANDLYNGTSYIYALHITGVTTATEFTVTPYYECTAGTVYGAAQTYSYTPPTPAA